MRVVVVNAAVLLGGLLLLVWTPVTVSAPVSARQVIVLTTAVFVLVIADAAVLRVSFSGLEALVRRMQTLDLLRPRERLPEMGGAETRSLIAGFNTMLDRLEAERRDSTGRTVTMLEDERLRISRELHDEIGSRMTGIVLRLGTIHEEAALTARTRIAALQDEVRTVMDEIGALAWRIRPAILDDLGLVSALRALTSTLGEDGSAAIEVSLPPRLPRMSVDLELAIYRIAQEALTNAMRHAGATVVAVRMQASPGDVVLQVIDDGRGMAANGAEGPGLRGMRERALLIGGVLHIGDNPPHGLHVELAVPIDAVGGSA